MGKRIGLLVIAIVIVIAAFALRRTRRPAAATTTDLTTAPAAMPAATGTSPPTAATTAAAPATAPTAAAPVRFRIPRPPSLPTATPAPTPAPVAGRAATDDDPGRPALRDRREGARGAIKAAEIHAKLDQVADDVEACLDEWRKLDPDLAPRVMLTFGLGPDGLGDVWLADHADIPAGPASCFSSAVYGLDWKGLTESPVEISQPYGDD